MKAVSSVNLMEILNEIDDHFLRASESAQEVFKMLGGTRLHYHSNFADNRGHIDHSVRVMRVITWNKSFRGMTNGENGKDEFDSEEYETHATVLDKLLAWEKKLYDEVKVHFKSWVYPFLSFQIYMASCLPWQSILLPQRTPFSVNLDIVVSHVDNRHANIKFPINQLQSSFLLNVLYRCNIILILIL